MPAPMSPRHSRARRAGTPDNQGRGSRYRRQLTAAELDIDGVFTVFSKADHGHRGQRAGCQIAGCCQLNGGVRAAYDGVIVFGVGPATGGPKRNEVRFGNRVPGTVASTS